MADINLLPNSATDQNTTTRFASISKKIGIIGSVLLVIVLLVYAGIYGFFYISGSVTQSSMDNVENQIKAQEVTEQKIVLLRDRANKASKILSASSSQDEISALSEILAHLPEGVLMKDSKIIPSELTISIQTDQSSQTTEFIRSLTESGKYSQIETVSMDFSAKDRYLSVFRLVLGQAL